MPKREERLSEEARRFAAEDSAFYSYVNRWGERAGIGADAKAEAEAAAQQEVNLSDIRLQAAMNAAGFESEQDYRNYLENDPKYHIYKDKFMDAASAEDYTGNSPIKTGDIDAMFALEDAFDESQGIMPEDYEDYEDYEPEDYEPEGYELKAAPKAEPAKPAAPKTKKKTKRVKVKVKSTKRNNPAQHVAAAQHVATAQQRAPKAQPIRAAAARVANVARSAFNAVKRLFGR